MPKKQKSKYETSLDISKKLTVAMNDVAQLLIDTMRDETAKIELRVNCAKEIKDWLFGRETMPVEQEYDEDQPFEVVIKVIE
ncbi:MAG: hypothetical protein BGN88_06820 [Clostridiales bacterium 43-6]|nr:MAG: hypothetical protein BGN88_06820 [Clostridiales bacterium 43-6]